MNRSDFFYGKLIFCILGSLVLAYWLNPDSRTAHFERIGTIKSPELLLLLPMILSLISLLIILFASSRHVSYLSTIVRTRRIDRRIPLVSFLLFTVIPYFSAFFGHSYVTDFYYRVMRVSNIEPTFADLRTILYGISCQQVNSVGDTIICDPRGPATIWNYPTFLLELRHIGFGIHLLLLLAIIFTIVIAIAIFLVSDSLSNLGRIWFAILVFSPPVLLCFDRMNFDLVIVSLVIFSVKILSQSSLSLVRFCFALSLLVFATFLKFYALPLLIILALRTIKNLEFFLISLVMTSTTIFFVVDDLTSLREFVGKDIRGSIGFNVLTSLLNGREVAALDLVSLGFLASLFVVSSLTLISHLNPSSLNSPSFLNLTCFSLSLLFLFPWLTTSSYYYRLVAIIFVIPLIISMHGQIFEKIAALSASLALYFSPSSLALVQNILLLPLVSLFISFSISFLLQNRFLGGDRNG